MEYIWGIFGYPEQKVEKRDLFRYDTENVKSIQNYSRDILSYVFNVMKKKEFEFISSFEHKDNKTHISTSYFGYKNKQLICVIAKVVTKNENYYLINFYFNYNNNFPLCPILTEDIKVLNLKDDNHTFVIKYKYDKKDLSILFEEFSEFMTTVKDGKFKSNKHISPIQLCDTFTGYFALDEDFINEFDNRFNLENLKDFVHGDEACRH